MLDTLPVAAQAELTLQCQANCLSRHKVMLGTLPITLQGELTLEAGNTA